MSKISNTSAYPTTAPAIGDLLIGTDINDSDATKTFTISSVVALAPVDTLEEVLTAGNTATNNITLTGNIALTGDLTGTGDITRTGDIALTGNLTGAGGITRTGAVNITGAITATGDVGGAAVTATTALQGATCRLTAIPVYADDTAAGLGGLVAGQLFQTSGTAGAPLNEPGIIMIKQ